MKSDTIRFTVTFLSIVITAFQKQQTRDEREGKRGQVKKNEGHKGGGGGAAARQKEVSTGKKRGRRGRLTHKELVVGKT